MSDIEIKDNTEEVLSALESAKKRALNAIGMTAERYAKEILTQEVYTVDKAESKRRGYKLTGRLRNSITYALSGEGAKMKEYSDNTKQTYRYQGTAPDDREQGVYLGTNVEYAAGIETGTHRRKGAVHFLQRASTEHTAEYQQLFEDSLKNA